MKISEKQNMEKVTSSEKATIPGPTLFVMMNHTLTAEQMKDAECWLGVEKVRCMPENLKKVWENIPPELPEIRHLLVPFEKWLEGAARKNDVVLIQGDFGVCYLMVNLVLKKGLVPVYATTKREVVEVPQADGSVRTERHFRHVMFRKYGE